MINMPKELQELFYAIKYPSTTIDLLQSHTLNYKRNRIAIDYRIAFNYYTCIIEMNYHSKVNRLNISIINPSSNISNDNPTNTKQFAIKNKNITHNLFTTIEDNIGEPIWPEWWERFT